MYLNTQIKWRITAKFLTSTLNYSLESAPFQTSCFSHEAHLRLAWIHIKKYGLEQAIDNLCNQIFDYANSLNAHQKFNKTVTVAAVKAVYHFMNRSASNDFYDLINEFPRLKTQFKELMNAHYGIDIFNSPKAKAEFIEPDLLPFS